MKYEIGDKVVIRDDLEKGVLYNHAYLNEHMNPLLGKTVTIVDIPCDGDYRIKEDNEIWYWSEEMIDHIETSKLKLEKMDLSDIKQSLFCEDIMIICDTEQDLEELFIYLTEYGYKWIDGESLIDNIEYFNFNKVSETLYRIGENGKVSYCQYRPDKVLEKVYRYTTKNIKGFKPINTWEILKMISDDYGSMKGKRFRLFSYGKYSWTKLFLDSVVRVDSTPRYGIGLYIKDKIVELTGLEVWVEVKEDVDFMTAINYFNHFNHIYCETEFGEIKSYNPNKSEDIYFLEDDILNGKWYID